MATRRSLPSKAGAVVTGGGSGLGRALCVELARRGAQVLIADIDLSAAEETASLVRNQGGVAHVETCDVRSEEAVFRLADAARELFGHSADIVCNNAGVAVAGPFSRISSEDWKWIVDINLWGVIHGCRAFAPAMLERRSGFILNVASAAGLLCAPEMAPYNVTKSAVVGLSETLFAEFASQGVQVSVLCPTFFETSIMDSSRGPVDGRMQSVAKKAMQRSKVQAPEVARAAVDGLIRGELYVVPMTDGRVFWRMKRANPQRFYELLEGGLDRVGRLLGRFG